MRKEKKTHNKNINIRPNKIKVMVLRQCSPLKISTDGTFLLPFKFTAKFKFSNVLVTRTDQSKTKVKIQDGYE